MCQCADSKWSKINLDSRCKQVHDKTLQNNLLSLQNTAEIPLSLDDSSLYLLSTAPHYFNHKSNFIYFYISRIAYALPHL